MLECSKRGWVANGPDFEWDLESVQITAILSLTILNLEKSPVFECSGFGMVVTIAKARPFENQTI